MTFSRKLFNKIVNNSVCRLRNLHKNKAITSEMTLDAIIYTLDFLDIDENYEIDDDLILVVETKYKLPQDDDKQTLRKANNMFNKIVSGIITIPLVENINENQDDNWNPKSLGKSYERKKKEWEEIQDRVDNIRTKYLQMIT